MKTHVFLFSQFTQDMVQVIQMCSSHASLCPLMHLDLWGAECRDVGSIIAGRVAADRKAHLLQSFCR